nr:hypothetical protein [Trinickia fusca]
MAANDWKYLTNLPRRGHIRALDMEWAYTRHGVGLRFVNGDGVVVDMHDHILKGDVIDAHRMCEYIISTQNNFNDDVKLYSKCEQALTDLESIGVIEKVGGGERLWRLTR